MKTSIQTNHREIQNTTLNESLNIQYSSNINSMFIDNPYIHSIWDIQNNTIYQENKTQQIPKNIKLSSQLSESWLEPINFENIILMPYVNSEYSHIIVMFPFYI